MPGNAAEELGGEKARLPRQSRGGRPSRDQSVQRINHLLDIAAQVFIKSGYAGTSIDDVAARSQVSKPTIYAHFRNKIGLFAATVDHIIKNRLAKVEKATSAESGIAALRQQVANILSIGIEPTHRGLFKLYLAEGDRFPDLFIAFSTSTERNTRQSLIDILQDYPEFQSLRVPVEVAAAFLLQCILTPVIRAVAEPIYRQGMDVEREAHLIVEHALFGIMNPQA